MTHSLDGLTPSSIENPNNLDELSIALANVSGSGQTAVPWGGGTRIEVGNIPTSYDVALDLSNITGEIEHVPGDMTVVANAGVTIGTLNAVLKKEGQRLPFEVRNPATATVGGSVASNAPGRRQSSTGGIRDWVIGMQIVLADGTITKSGGRVVKNVQGYEMHRLHTGAFGTLGVVSQTAFKLLPMPPEQQTVILWFDDPEIAESIGMNIVNGLFAPEAISLLSGPLAAQVIDAAGEAAPAGDSWTLLIRLGGGVRSIERQVNEVVGAAGSQGATGYAVLSDSAASATWAKLDEVETETKLSIRVNARTGDALKISRTILSDSSSTETEPSTISDLGFGSTTALSVSDANASQFVDSVLNSCVTYDSSYVIEKCPLNVKESRDVFSDVGSSIALMRRIKYQYDPANTLNPGRFAGKL